MKATVSVTLILASAWALGFEEGYIKCFWPRSSLGLGAGFLGQPRAEDRVDLV